MSTTQISGSLVRRTYSNFRGLDMRDGEISFYRSPLCMNLWKNYNSYSSPSVIETRPGMVQQQATNESVHGLFFYEIGNTVHKMYVAGTTLYDDTTAIKTGMSTLNTQFFVYNNILYILDGTQYLRYDGETCSDVVGYIPTTSISRNPAGGGTTNEDVNMLSNYRTNTFCADGTSTEYYVDSETIDGILSVKVNGTLTTDYTIQTTSKAHITFNTAPAAPDTDGEDNVEITYIKDANERVRITSCTIVAQFDNRVFFSGNPDYPNVLWHCSLNDPTYFSDLDYYNEGDLSPIKAIVPGNNALWVLKKPSQANTTIFYHNPTIDSEYGKIYPSTHSSITTGCVTTGRNFNDAIVFFSERGMERITGDITTEQVVSHASSYIDNLIQETYLYGSMVLEEYMGYLFVIIGNVILLADSRGITSENGNYEYDWYYWKMEEKINCTCVYDNVLYLGTDKGIYNLDFDYPYTECYWTTFKDAFNYLNYQKITNKKGCVVEVDGINVSVSVKSNKEDDFATIKTQEDVTDYMTARIKRKKFKDLQIKISSDTYMKLKSISIESFIGGYIKR